MIITGIRVVVTSCVMVVLLTGRTYRRLLGDGHVPFLENVDILILQSPMFKRDGIQHLGIKSSDLYFHFTISRWLCSKESAYKAGDVG